MKKPFVDYTEKEWERFSKGESIDAEKVALYCRVSTSLQDTARQKADLEAVCEKRNWDIVETYQETESGTKAARPALAALMADAKKRKFQRVLVTEISRLGRKPSHVLDTIEQLSKWGISVYFHDFKMETLLEDGIRNFVTEILVAVLSSLAAAENEQRNARIKSGMLFAKSQGVILGRPKGVCQTDEEFLQKHVKIMEYLMKGLSVRETAKLTGKSTRTVMSVKKLRHLWE